MQATPAIPVAASPLQALINQHRDQPGGLLPLLHAVQDSLGHVPADAVPAIAAALNLSRAEVHGVITYYHFFRSAPPGRHVVQVCRAEACQACGAEDLLAQAEQLLGCKSHSTRLDGMVTLEPVYCLGLCASSPAMQVGDKLHARVTPQRLQQLVAQMEGVVMTAASTPVSTTAGGLDAMQVFVPRDSAALAVGADEVAAALRDTATTHGRAVQLVRNGSRGLFWLEPLLEVQTPHGRVAYGPVQAEDLPALWPALVADAAGLAVEHPLRHGLTEAIPYLANQQRLTFQRIGVTDPLSLADYAAHGGWAGLQAAVAMAPEAIVAEVMTSGLRGRGGAAFPAAIKWKTVAAAKSEHQDPQKYIVCNADEGDSGTYADRMVMEGDPYMLAEGMAIAGLATGATIGYIYIRSEYPDAVAVMREAIVRATAAGWLGSNVAGSGRAFHLEVRKAAGAYVCGEETAMLESIEGKRGIVRAKPPLPALQGLFGLPTVINNVLTLAAVPLILAKGGQHYKDYGVGRSTGTLPFQLAGNIARGGLVERAFGLTLRELVYDYGGGTRSGRPVKAIQVGGPLGAYVPESLWDLPLDYEAYAAKGLVVGHGGLVVHDDTADMAKLARYAMEFCALESCGKCTPCRIGSTRGVEVIDRISTNRNRAQQVILLRDLCDTMVNGSLCAMGNMTPIPVLSALNHYPEDFGIAAPEKQAA